MNSFTPHLIPCNTSGILGSAAYPFHPPSLGRAAFSLKPYIRVFMIDSSEQIVYGDQMESFYYDAVFV